MRASRCGRFIALEWQIADSLHHTPESALITWDVGSGKPIWGHLERDEALVFATYEHVITQRKDGRYSLLDIHSGQTALTISARYFAKMIGNSMSVSPLFQRANWVGTTRQAAFDALTDYPTVRARERGVHTHRPKHFKLPEHADLRDPMGLDAAVVRVENNWHHAHFQAPPNNFPMCYLEGGASIGLLPTE